MKITKLKSNNGFTIIELMIATSVLSVILVLVTILMMSIGNLYYKGVNQSRAQDDTRSITDELSQHLQLSSQQPSTGSQAFPGGVTVSAYCIDTTRYSYVTGVQSGQIPPSASTVLRHVLWRDAIPAGSNCGAADLTSNDPTSSSLDDVKGVDGSGTELVSPHSRLTQFCIGSIDSGGTCTTNVNSPYTIEVGVAYGDSDLLKYIKPPPLNSPNAVCSGDKGDQFCATAYLNTTVVKRLTDDSL